MSEEGNFPDLVHALGGPVDLVANADGNGGAVVPPGTRVVRPHSASAAYLFTLPPPDPYGEIVFLRDVNLVGFRVQADDPHTVLINDVGDTAYSLHVDAADLVIFKAITKTDWLAIKIGNTGTPASAGTPDDSVSPP